MYLKTITIIICFFLISCIVMAEDQSGKVIIKSSPLECNVLFGQKNEKVENKMVVKGGVVSNHPSFMMNIKKVEDIVIIEDVPVGKYPIVFKQGDKTIESEVDVQAGKAVLVKGDIGKSKVLITPQVFTGKDGAPMVLIPVSEFLMGSDQGELDELPIHKVYVDSFYMDVYEVTNAMYKKFIEATEHKPPKYWDDPKCNATDQPVVGVTWQDAVDYCNWAGNRLPTEAEWEKAARGGLIGKQYPWGDEENIEQPSGELLADENPGLSAAYPVGSFAPNGYGLHDMERNAWEWCTDWYDEEYYSKSPDKNPKGPNSGVKKIMRGGSWFSGIYTPLRVSYRYSLEPTQTSNIIGFRCIQEVK
jgi:formylglycine-generating enzyme required for sulfatase activity